MYRMIFFIVSAFVLIGTSVPLMGGEVTQPEVCAVREESGSFQCELQVEGKGKYPYPNTSDRINQMMGRRLAIYNGMTKVYNLLLSLQPFLDPIYQSNQEKGFVQGAYVYDSGFRTSYATVQVSFFFICSEDQYSQMQQSLSSKINFTVLSKNEESLMKKRENGYEVIQEHWKKLSKFAKHMG
ncbi:hypothetical protein AB834_05835 [PVC group bacterium (ex Bugula neritina AB1)]|nr:hypothetical protein AB834_05835 [PVC group bacterium (ex Bugula neritina AB1)]